CQIESNGEQPKSGVYFVVLTKPAPCDFRMPKVGILSWAGTGATQTAVFTDVLIGTYWLIGETMGAAHPFSVVKDRPKGPNGNVLAVDNGFLLVQPDHKSYLLADGGFALTEMLREKFPSVYHSTATVAKDLSRTMGIGDTELLQPSPGSASDNYASGTLFKKGSVVAMYDDTSDMGGGIDVKALTQSIQSVGMKLTWDAQ
ncbi:MAG: hypothetical protein WCO71_09445, partial [Pseudomonadota bacterium]